MTDLYSTYQRINSVSPRTLLKIVLYSYINGDYSSCSMELNCKKDINIMFLLKVKKLRIMQTLLDSEVFILPPVPSVFLQKCQTLFLNLVKSQVKLFLSMALKLEPVLINILLPGKKL